MVVQHNMQAMNANRMLNITTGSQAKSTEKLSSGYRINRAADDAAGLSISEKMRKQIKGLDKASSNAQDGISAVQTAEGALTEVHSMLQRMNELATQAANGTNSDGDRQSIQDEIDQLTTEIDRVAETTKFNEIYLLKGDASGAKTTKTVNAHDAGIKGTLTANANGTSTFKLEEALKAGDKITVAGEELTIGDTKEKDDYTALADLNKTKVQVGDSITTASGVTKTITNNATDDDIATWLSNTSGKALDATGTASVGTLTLADGTTYNIQQSATKLQPTITKVGTDGVTTTKTAASAITAGDSIDKVINKVFATDTVDLAGATFTSADGKATFNIVDKMNRDELTVFDASTGTTVVADATDVGNNLAATAGDTTIAKVLDLVTNGGDAGQSVGELKVGDTVTILKTDDKGNKVETSKTAYDATKAAGNVKSLDELATALGKLAVGSKVRVASMDGDVTLGTPAAGKYTEYTIAGSKDAENGSTLTVDSILAKVKEGSIVGVDPDKDGTFVAADAYSIAGVDSEENTTSIKDAYKKIADALTEASSVGTDEAAVTTSNGDGSFTIKQGTTEVTESLNFNLHVGADADMTNKINVDVSAMDSAALGIKGINVNDATGVKATYAIDAIEDAIKTVSSQRSALGAVQNRLEHTIANLDNIVENTTSAESAIRDTDMADEMVNYSKNNILAQAGQSMLAQANQSNQGVLSLLG